jgi:hypothetical protein
MAKQRPSAAGRRKPGAALAEPRLRGFSNAERARLLTPAQGPAASEVREKLKLVLEFIAAPAGGGKGRLIGSLAGQMAPLVDLYLRGVDSRVVAAFLAWLSTALDRCANPDVGSTELRAWLRGEMTDTITREIEAVRSLQRQLAEETATDPEQVQSAEHHDGKLT